MSLRLLPAITLDNDEDDDGNFTKWMSSYWGHGAESGHSRDRKRSFRRPARSQTDRRGSLPTVSQLDAMKLNKLHAATMAPSPSHMKTRDECLEVRPHPRARRASSDDNGRPKTAIPETRISTIPEMIAPLEQRVRTISLNEDNRLCLICYEDMKKNGVGTKELQCTHRFHKEVKRSLCPLHGHRLQRLISLVQCMRRSHICMTRDGMKTNSKHYNKAGAFTDCAGLKGLRRLDQQRRSSEAGQVHRQTEERRKSSEGHMSTQKEPPLHRQLSLRKHR